MVGAPDALAYHAVEEYSLPQAIRLNWQVAAPRLRVPQATRSCATASRRGVLAQVARRARARARRPRRSRAARRWPSPCGPVRAAGAQPARSAPALARRERGGAARPGGRRPGRAPDDGPAAASATGCHSVRPALLNFAYWPEVRRGNERLVHDLAVELARRGGEPAIVTSHPGPSERTVEEGVTVIRRCRPPERPSAAPHPAEPDPRPALPRGLRRGDFDLAHAFFPTDALAAMRWSAATGRPAVFTITGVMRRETSRTCASASRSSSGAPAPDAVVTISAAAAMRSGAGWRSSRG